VTEVQKYLPGVSVLNLPWKRGQAGKDLADWRRYNLDVELRLLVQSMLDKSSGGVMSSEELLESATTQKHWLIENLITRHQMCFVVGAPKSFKS